MSEIRKTLHSGSVKDTLYILSWPSYFAKGGLGSVLMRNASFCKASFYMPDYLYVLDREPINLTWGCVFHFLAGMLKVTFSAIVSIVILQSLYGPTLLKTYD